MGGYGVLMPFARSVSLFSILKGREWAKRGFKILEYACLDEIGVDKGSAKECLKLSNDKIRVKRL